MDLFHMDTCDLVPNTFSEVPALMRGATKCSLVLAAASPLDRQGYFSPGAHADYAAVMIGERTRKLIGIAHPKFRDELERRAREMDYLRIRFSGASIELVGRCCP